MAKTKILLLSADPSKKLDLKGERDRIQRAIDQSTHASDFELEIREAVTARELMTLLRDYQPDIVHFGGHGATSGELVFVDDLGRPHTPQMEWLAEVFQAIAPHTRLVVLNACLSQSQAGVIARHIECVVGMARPIRDPSAIAFADHFYSALAHDGNVRRAFHESILRLKLDPKNEADTPLLIEREDVFADEVVLIPGAPRVGINGNVSPVAQNIPRQIPAPPGDFTGRCVELARLADALAAGKAAISALAGMGGVGKSALAFKLAHKYRRRYPDGMIYLDLKGTDADPEKRPKPIDILAHAIRAYHPEARLPEDLASLQALFRQVFEGKRTILLWDNAHDRKQVEPIEAPPGCLTMVTSRQRFSLPGFTLVKVDELPEPDAITLLNTLCPRLPGIEGGKWSAVIARQCGCLPLALRLTGTALAEHEDLSPAKYSQRLENQGIAFLEQHADESDPHRKVHSSIALSEALLSEELRDKFRRLAVMPADFNAPAAAAVWGMLPHRDNIGPLAFIEAEVAAHSIVEKAADTLSELARLSMVGFDEQTTRYRLHDLVREYAAANVPSASRDAACHAFARHFADIAFLSDSFFCSKEAGPVVGLSLFDLEFRNIIEGFDWAKANASIDPSALSLCCAYPSRAIHCLGLRLHARQRIDWLETALGAARALKDRRAEACAIGNLGGAYIVLGDWRKAIECGKDSLAIARELTDKRGEGNALGTLGNAHLLLGELPIAIDYYKQSLSVAREVGDRRSEGNSLGNLGLAFATIGDFTAAIEYQLMRLAVARDIGDRCGEGSALLGVGIAHAALGRLHAGIEYYKQSLAIVLEMGDRVGQGTVLGNLGVAHARLGEPHAAIGFYEQELALARETGNRRGESASLGNLGNAHSVLGNAARADECFALQLAIARDIGDRAGEIVSGWNLGARFLWQGDLAQAIPLMHECVEYFREIGHAETESRARFVAILRQIAAQVAHLPEDQRPTAVLAIFKQLEEEKPAGDDPDDSPPAAPSPPPA